jgi:hypothetical protein
MNLLTQIWAPPTFPAHAGPKPEGLKSFARAAARSFARTTPAAYVDNGLASLALTNEFADANLGPAFAGKEWGAEKEWAVSLSPRACGVHPLPFPAHAVLHPPPFPAHAGSTVSHPRAII